MVTDQGFFQGRIIAWKTPNGKLMLAIPVELGETEPSKCFHVIDTLNARSVMESVLEKNENEVNYVITYATNDEWWSIKENVEILTRVVDLVVEERIMATEESIVDIDELKEAFDVQKRLESR